ncbi:MULTISPECIES: hypothetical protein [Vibrio]|uniref:hypothetical protein n=1 Tax=Vibrio TaxID=662 RepID=UPI00076A3891|nr:MULTISPECIES: hypothetical protein [Vibrio]HDM8223176.1 hypothetical protein [Vibrio campbellii]AQW61489.1 hypothetical protein A9237_26135 [Vibrio owensii]HDM8225501.1 hypothetical protein [Vibrio campbellii]HDM8226005.1 hypothetical protein [Vibrio campbellii]HDM8243040.1 hypothetical protein [Vibrio campbellii]
MRLLKLAILMLFSISPLTSNAKYFTALNSEGVEITRIHNHANGGLTLYISGSIVNLDNCTVTSRVHLKGDLKGHDNMVSAALMAFATGKRIGLHASGCEIIPFWGTSGGLTPVISDLWVLN